jgi:hypothetical protein
VGLDHRGEGCAIDPPEQVTHVQGVAGDGVRDPGRELRGTPLDDALPPDRSDADEVRRPEHELDRRPLGDQPDDGAGDG